MGRKPQGRTAKIQRGLSLDPELHKAIQADADRLGKSWNDIAESVLKQAFFVQNGSHPVEKSSHETEPTGVFG